MSDRYQSEAYKQWAGEQDSEIQTRRQTGDYPTWQWMTEGVGLLPEKGMAAVADMNRDAKRLKPGGDLVSAGDIRQSLFEQMRAIADKQHQKQKLSEAEQKAANDWSTLVNTGTVYFP
jgi:hypothetical protein